MSMFPIASITIGSGGATGLSFISIPQNFTHLQMRVFARSSTSAAGVNVPLQFNSDTGNNYVAHYLGGDGSSAFSGVYGAPANSSNAGWVAGTTNTTNAFGCCIVDILDYTNTSKYTTVKSISGIDSNGSGLTGLWSGVWMNTSAITQIAFSLGTSAQYSRFDLYGITTSNATGA